MSRPSPGAEDSSVVVLEERQLHWAVVDRRLSCLLEEMPGHCLWARMRFGELGRTLEVADSSFAPSSAGLRYGQQNHVVVRRRH